MSNKWEKENEKKEKKKKKRKIFSFSIVIKESLCILSNMHPSIYADDRQILPSKDITITETSS